MLSGSQRKVSWSVVLQFKSDYLLDFIGCLWFQPESFPELMPLWPLEVHTLAMSSQYTTPIFILATTLKVLQVLVLQKFHQKASRPNGTVPAAMLLKRALLAVARPGDAAGGGAGTSGETTNGRRPATCGSAEPRSHFQMSNPPIPPSWLEC